jgi:hypothetical protein
MTGLPAHFLPADFFAAFAALSAVGSFASVVGSKCTGLGPVADRLLVPATATAVPSPDSVGEVVCATVGHMAAPQPPFDGGQGDEIAPP